MTLNVYRALAGASIRARLQYRLSAISRAVTLALADLTPLLLIGVVLSQFTSVGGWRWPELALLFGLVQLASALARCFSWQLDHFDEYITSGEFDLFLVRPLPPLVHLLAIRFEIVQVGRVAVGIATIAVACQVTGVWATPANIAVIATAAAGGALLLFSLTLAIASLSFWHTRTGKLQDVVQSGCRAFAEYPLAIYPRSVRIALTTVLPLALITYHPALYLLGRQTSILAFAAVPVSAAFLVLALALWRAGLRRYQSTGS
jgi:ABC-2 type transport system permease protein